jgi:hypothetical protein
MAKHNKKYNKRPQKFLFRPRSTLPKAAPVKVARDNINSAQDALAKTEEASKAVVESYAAGVGGASHFGLHLIDIARANASAAFDLGRQLMTAKSLSEIFELSAAHTKRQLDRFAEENQQVSEIMQQALAKSFSLQTQRQR